MSTAKERITAKCMAVFENAIYKIARANGFTNVIISSFESIRGKSDRRRLNKEITQLRNFDVLALECRQELQQTYEQYVSKASTDLMAISLELSTFLMVLCDILKPRRILDLGSGFSSFVFRLSILDTTPTSSILSVDDSIEWLEKTGKFLAANNLPCENLITWSSFTKQNHGTFDLIFHDLGSMEVRKKTLKKVLTLLRPGGIMLLDDIHKDDYRSYAKQVLTDYGFKYYSLKSFTLDKFRRYSMFATQIKKTTNEIEKTGCQQPNLPMDPKNSKTTANYSARAQIITIS